MVKRIDSQALGILNKSMGLSGAGSPLTELADGVVDQVLSVGEIVRRGRVLGITEGIFVCRLRCNHVAANSLTATIAPFAAGAALVDAPFPSPIPSQFDFWLLGASVFVVGAGTLSGTLLLRTPALVQGLSVTNAGGAVTANVISHPLAFWDTTATESIEFGVLTGTVGVWKKLGLRLPRHPDTELRFASTSSDVVTFDCNIICGLFPVALGQDVLV